MDQAYVMTENTAGYGSDWRFKKAAQVKLNEKKQNEKKYHDENIEIKKQQRLLEYERQEFQRIKKFEEKRLEREKRIFDMEWKMLEEGWRNLAAEREQLERVYGGNGEEAKVSFGDISVSAFFSGVNNTRALRKRYKDLIKIFHPDNAQGDTEVLQKINEEYEALKKRLGLDRT